MSQPLVKNNNAAHQAYTHHALSNKWPHLRVLYIYNIFYRFYLCEKSLFTWSVGAVDESLLDVLRECDESLLHIDAILRAGFEELNAVFVGERFAPRTIYNLNIILVVNNVEGYTEACEGCGNNEEIARQVDVVLPSFQPYHICYQSKFYLRIQLRVVRYF